MMGRVGPGHLDPIQRVKWDPTCGKPCKICVRACG